jgi:integrase
MAAIRDQVFREFVFAMYETGCRPSEVSRVTARHVNLELGAWGFADHKTVKKTGKPRIVYLRSARIEFTKHLMAEHPDGPLFRRPRGKRPFTRNSIRCRFKRLRQKLPHLKGRIDTPIAVFLTGDPIRRHRLRRRTAGTGLPSPISALCPTPSYHGVTMAFASSGNFCAAR